MTQIYQSLSLHKLKDAWTASIFWPIYLCKCYIFIEGVLWNVFPPFCNKKPKKLLSYMVSTTHVQFHRNIKHATPLKSNILFFLGWLCHSSFALTIKTGPSICTSSLASNIIMFYSSHSDGHIVICLQGFNLSSLNGTEKWTIFQGVYSLLYSLLRKHVCWYLLTVFLDS